MAHGHLNSPGLMRFVNNCIGFIDVLHNDSMFLELGLEQKNNKKTTKFQA